MVKKFEQNILTGNVELKEKELDTKLDLIYFQNSFDWREFACGCGASLISIAITFPIYKTIFRQMLHGVEIKSALKQLNHEGFTYLYRGIAPPLAQKPLSLSIMFGVFNGTRNFAINNFNVNPYSAKIFAGLVSGTLEAILLPFDRVHTLLADSRYHLQFRNMRSAFSHIWKNYGFKEFYKGIMPILCKNGPANCIFFTLKEEAHIRLPERRHEAAKSIQEFLSGAVIGSTVATIFYPINVIKIQMQKDIGEPTQTIRSVFRKIYNERGGKISNIYKGCVFNLCRSFISWGIMNTSYEYLKQILY